MKRFVLLALVSILAVALPGPASSLSPEGCMAKTTEDLGEKPTACVDLDGVLNLYDGWKGAHYFHGVRPGARDFLLNLGVDYQVIVHTTRDIDKTVQWLRDNQLYSLVNGVSNEKPPAVVYIDDRAVTFEGDFDAVLEEVRGFAPFWNPEENLGGGDAPGA